MDSLRILVPTPMMGYGFPIKEFERGLTYKPHAIVLDAGSTDSGPQKLALGEMTCPASAYKKEMEILIPAAVKAKVPLIITSAGGDGTNEHVDLFMELAESVAKAHQLEIRIAAVYSDIPKDTVREALKNNKISAMTNVPDLTFEDIDDVTVITAQMGAEPYINLLQSENPPHVIIGGRTYDPAPTAAIGIMNGFDPALAWHMGKIIECGALCAVPSGKSVIGTLYHDHFTIEPMNENSQAKPHTVAAHTMYEKSSPSILPGPGGQLLLNDCAFSAVTDSVAQVSGSKFAPDTQYRIKLEGAKIVGYRSITVMGLRDPILLSQLDDVLNYVRTEVAKALPDESSQCTIIMHEYGRNGIMQSLESYDGPSAHEVCVIAEVTGPTQEIAQLVTNRVRTTLLHYHYPGRIATSGNIGMPFTPLEIPLGPVCAFNVYHLMDITDPIAQFPTRITEVTL